MALRTRPVGGAGWQALVLSLLGHMFLAIVLLVELIAVKERDARENSFFAVGFPRSRAERRVLRRPLRTPKRSAEIPSPSPTPATTRRPFSDVTIPVTSGAYSTSVPSSVDWEGPVVRMPESPRPVWQLREARRKRFTPVRVSPPLIKPAGDVQAARTQVSLAIAPTMLPAPTRQRQVAQRETGVPRLSQIGVVSAPGPGQKTMTATDIARVAGATGDVLKALSVLPGIVSAGELSGELYVRGGSPEENRFYFDRIPLGYPYHFGGLVSTISNEVIERIDVHAGGFGAQFGEAQAIIDIAPRARSRDGFRGVIDVDLLLSEWFAQAPVGESGSAHFAGRRSYLDLFVPQLVTIEKLTAFPRFWDYQAGAEWDLSDSQHLRLTTFAAGDFVQLFLDEEDVTDEPEFAGEFRYRYGLYGRGGTFTSDLGDRGRLLSTLSQFGGDFDFKFGQGFYIRIDTDMSSLRQDVVLPLSDRHTLEVGHELSTGHVGSGGFFAIEPEEEDPDFDYAKEAKKYADARERLTWLHGYMQDRVRVTERLTLTLGGRAGYYNMTDEAYVDPRASLEYKWDTGPTVRAACGVYRQSPNALQISEKWGNPDLSSNRATHYILELERRLSDELLVKAAGYCKALDHLVTEDPVAVYLNQGDGFARGLEVFAKYTPSDRLLGWLSYTYGLSKRRDTPSDELRLRSFDQTHVATAVLSYRPTGPRGKWSIDVKWQYATGQPYTPILGSEAVVNADGRVEYEPVYGPVNSRRVPAFDRTDVRLARRFSIFGAAAEAYLEVLNATNRRNVVDVEYNEDLGEEESVGQLPLIPFIGIAARF